MKITTIFFDLDNTLYPPECGLWDVISQRISQFMLEKINIPEEQISALRQHFRDNYGTTLQGLRENFAILEEDYMEFVHDIPLTQYIHPDPMLKQMLNSLSLRKIIFTNASRFHSLRVLETLEITDQFDQIIDIADIYPFSKSQRESFLLAMNKAREPFSYRCAMVDDMMQNLIAARQAGLFPILVWEKNSKFYPFTCISNILDLPSILPKV